MEYWRIFFKKVESAERGAVSCKGLAKYLERKEPALKGFSDKNLWRIKQFFETYKDYPKLSTVLREVSWSHNLAIFSRCKTIEEREFILGCASRKDIALENLTVKFRQAFLKGQ